MGTPRDILLVTGGCGFIGSNFIRRALAEDSHRIVLNLDHLTYAGNPANVADVALAHAAERYFFIRGDVSDPELARSVFRGERSAGWVPDRVIHFAAETHVDRSILSAGDFIRTNVQGTQTLLDAAREAGVTRFVQVSTDEVYGSLNDSDPPFKETHPLAPNSPYAASKAAADLLVRAARRTHGLDVVITRSSNNYGPYQYPEKLIPLMILRALQGESLPVYGDGLNVRDWIHVEDHCRALLLVLKRGKAGGIYNIGGGNEYTNLTLVRVLLDLMGQPHRLINFVKDRPGHDRRYALDSSKIQKELGWKPAVLMEEGLRSTLQWYRDHENWWRPLLDESYQSFMKTQYGADAAVNDSTLG